MEAVGQLAGGVAHDFNNLVTAIRGYADLLSDTIAEGDEGHAEVIEIIKASERAGGFTRQLLAFSRKETFEPKRLDLNSLVLDISTMLRRLLSGEDIELALALAPSVAPVRADAGQIGQVLMNLAINSRDAMPNGGRLSIETADVTLDDEYTLTHLVVRPGPYVLLSVSDNGFGMDAATRRRIFEPFFTTKEHGRGTGLGLATVDAIVKRSGGCMSVYSEPGHGTTFKIYLPCAEEE
jgi:two-component system cell cycle sensor histidine kinase/response regulator CckA